MMRDPADCHHCCVTLAQGKLEISVGASGDWKTGFFTYDSEGDIIEQWYDASGSQSSSVNKWRITTFHGVLPPQGFSFAAMRKRKLRFNVDTKDQHSGMTGPQLRFNAFNQEGKDAWLLALDSDETIEKGEDDTAADDEIEEGGGGDGAGKSSAGTANEEAANAAPAPASAGKSSAGTANEEAANAAPVPASEGKSSAGTANEEAANAAPVPASSAGTANEEAANAAPVPASELERHIESDSRSKDDPEGMAEPAGSSQPTARNAARAAVSPVLGPGSFLVSKDKRDKFKFVPSKTSLAGDDVEDSYCDICYERDGQLVMRAFTCKPSTFDICGTCLDQDAVIMSKTVAWKMSEKRYQMVVDESKTQDVHKDATVAKAKAKDTSSKTDRSDFATKTRPGQATTTQAGEGPKGFMLTNIDESKLVTKEQSTKTKKMTFDIEHVEDGPKIADGDSFTYKTPTSGAGACSWSGDGDAWGGDCVVSRVGSELCVRQTSNLQSGEPLFKTSDGGGCTMLEIEQVVGNTTSYKEVTIQWLAKKMPNGKPEGTKVAESGIKGAAAVPRKVGDEVKAQFNATGDHYKGKIQKVNDDGTFDVLFDVTTSDPRRKLRAQLVDTGGRLQIKVTFKSVSKAHKGGSTFTFVGAAESDRSALLITYNCPPNWTGPVQLRGGCPVQRADYLKTGQVPFFVMEVLKSKSTDQPKSADPEIEIHRPTRLAQYGAPPLLPTTRDPPPPPAFISLGVAEPDGEYNNQLNKHNTSKLPAAELWAQNLKPGSVKCEDSSEEAIATRNQFLYRSTGEVVSFGDNPTAAGSGGKFFKPEADDDVETAKYNDEQSGELNIVGCGLVWHPRLEVFCTLGSSKRRREEFAKLQKKQAERDGKKSLTKQDELLLRDYASQGDNRYVGSGYNASGPRIDSAYPLVTFSGIKSATIKLSWRRRPDARVQAHDWRTEFSGDEKGIIDKSFVQSKIQTVLGTVQEGRRLASIPYLSESKGTLDCIHKKAEANGAKLSDTLTNLLAQHVSCSPPAISVTNLLSTPSPSWFYFAGRHAQFRFQNWR
jgi:hypothetical protein